MFISPCSIVNTSTPPRLPAFSSAANKFRAGRYLPLFAVLGCLGLRSSFAAISPQDAQFFESRIRPVLVNHCYKCHSAQSERLKGGLRLDTRQDLLKGGNTGPVLVPGNPDNSLLIKAVRYLDEDLQMPPNDQKLPARQIADLEQWVRMGAPDPRGDQADKVDLYALDRAKAMKHWAFQPIFPPAPPEVNDSKGWASSPIDRYILATLQREGLAPSEKADKVSLIRRASFDLIGLPPTIAEVDAFVADTSPTAFSNVVVRLLASPQYGERWGRHWLDLARYADTTGNTGNNRETRFIHAYTYRDYVIRAFNHDLPYNRFLLEQIAADQLNLGTNQAAMAALGFLTLGNRFNNNKEDIIDDRIDAVSKATMALTVSCARCHDHKFDPIPTADYYSLRGIFNSCYEPEDGPIVQEPKDQRARLEFEKLLEAKEAELEKFQEDVIVPMRKSLIGRGGEYLLAYYQHAKSTNGLPRSRFLDQRGLNRQWSSSWENGLKKWQKKHDPIFGPWVELAALSERDFSAKIYELSAAYRANKDSGKPLNPIISRLFSTPPSSMEELAQRYSKVFMDVESRWQSTLGPRQKKSSSSSRQPPSALSDANMELIRQAFYNSRSPVYLEERIVTEAIRRDNRIRDRINRTEREIAELKAEHPGAPARAVVLLDKKDPANSRIFIRGNPGNRGDEVPRRFLEILSPENRPSFRQGSGRLELAKCIASEDNPLTARVMVNRIWQHHFGEGLVRTVNDFGLRSEPPTHPELLDYLAWTFMENGWSIKKMHLLIMLSSVYQQSSLENPRLAQLDKNNKWLWRFNRQRLDFEALRDTILYIGGKLDLTLGGAPVELDAVPFPERRSIYGFVDRNRLPDMYRAFDFANPDLSTGKRDVTTVPQQALFLMNSPLVVEQAINLTRRTDFAALAKNEDRIQLLYRLIYQRLPTPAEMKLTLAYLRAEPSMPKVPIPGETPWEYGVGQFDPLTRQVRGFFRMQYVRGEWNGPAGAKLTRDGGVAGPYPQQPVIRRWTAPTDGMVSIHSVLTHTAEGSDGLQARVVSSRRGELGAWAGLKSQTPISLNGIQVMEGDTIDFLIDCRGHNRGDEFAWTPVIVMSQAAAADGATSQTTWDSRQEFSGATRRRLLVWEKLAQTLLQTNELTFYN